MPHIILLIYVNYVVSSIICNYKLFTDDIKLYLSFDVTDTSSVITVGQDKKNRLVGANYYAWVLSMNVCL